MTASKPRLRIVDGIPVEVKLESPALTEARIRFGRKFACEPGSNWKPRSTPFLLEWLSRRRES